MSTGAERREIVVVGAGLVGLATAAELARRGRDVLCLEREHVGHERSGSKGTARIFRLGYADSIYVTMGRRSLEEWRRLEDESKEQLFVPVGFLTLGGNLEVVRDAMVGAGAPPQVLSSEEVAERFPAFGVAGRALYEPGAGVLAADRVLATLRAAVPDLREGTEVISIRDGGRSVAVGTANGPIECGTAVLCAGAWSGTLAAAAGLTGARRLTPSWQQVAYFDTRPWAGAIPAFVRWGALTIYGLPDPRHRALAEGTYKVGVHDAGPPADPGAAVPAAEPGDLGRLAAIVADALPGLDPLPRASDVCPYDNSPDSDLVIDRVGRIVIGAGTSGHGFKFGPVLGGALADLAEGTEPALPMARFSLSRATMSAGSPASGRPPPT